MKKKAYELEFISQIKRNGSGVTKVRKDYLKYMLDRNEIFELHALSLSEKTFIAFNINVFIVKLKNKS